MLPLIYVAGPYRAATRDDIARNIDAARSVGISAAALGWFPVIPHANTAHMELDLPGLGDDFWLAGTLEMMERCDAVVLIPGWQNSAGTRGEIIRAEELGIPVFRTLDALPSASVFLDWASVAGHRASALAYGKQRRTPPPAGHWLEPFYEMGMAEADERDGARSLPVGVPDGWALVPVEPTLEMVAALGFNGDIELAIGHGAIGEEVIEQYSAMLAAAPAAPTVKAEQVSAAARDVLAERQRQINDEGWTPEHDDEHNQGELAVAAACYAFHANREASKCAHSWPWQMAWHKPTNERRDLVKAGALILAEIERLDRAEQAKQQEGQL